METEFQIKSTSILTMMEFLILLLEAGGVDIDGDEGWTESLMMATNNDGWSNVFDDQDCGKYLADPDQDGIVIKTE